VKVRGDIKAIAFPQKGSISTGINIPLMNIRGNLTRAESIIIWEGASVAGAARSVPSEEKQKAERITPPARRKG